RRGRGLAVEADVDDLQLVAARLVDADGGGDQGLDLLHLLFGAGRVGRFAPALGGGGVFAVDRHRDRQLPDLARLLHRRRGGVGDFVVGRLGVLGAGRTERRRVGRLSAGDVVGGGDAAVLLAGRILRLAAVGRGRANDLAVRIETLLLGGRAAVIDIGRHLHARGADADDALDDILDARLHLGLGRGLGRLGGGRGEAGVLGPGRQS